VKASEAPIAMAILLYIGVYRRAFIGGDRR
jgi:hypothetical protein